MSDYKANYEAALTYVKVGYKSKALESLERAYAQLTQEDKHIDNRDCIAIYRMLLKSYLEEKRLEDVEWLLKEAFQVDDQDVDFIFYNLMLLVDTNEYQKLFPMLVNYLLSVDLATHKGVECTYGGEEKVNEVINIILPLSINHMHSIDDLESVVVGIQGKVGSPSLERLLESMRQYRKAS